MCVECVSASILLHILTVNISKLICGLKMDSKNIFVVMITILSLFNFGCSGNATENSVEELRLGLEKLGNNASGDAEKFDPVMLGDLIEQNNGLKSEVLKLQEIINSSMLGKYSFKADSNVVFEIEQYTGSFELNAWVGSVGQKKIGGLEDRFIYNLTYPNRASKLFSSTNFDTVVTECELASINQPSPWITKGIMCPGSSLSMGVANTRNMLKECNARFKHAVGGEKFGIHDLNAKTHTINLRTEHPGEYSLYMQLKPLEKRWLVRFRIYEEKNGAKKQLVVGEINSRNFNEIKVGKKSEIMEISRFYVNAPKVDV